MKKYISLVVILLLLLSCFTGCSESEYIIADVDAYSEGSRVIEVHIGEKLYTLHLTDDAKLKWDIEDNCLTNEEKKDWKLLRNGTTVKANLTELIEEHSHGAVYKCNKITVVDVNDDFYDAFEHNHDEDLVAKPVIYLYPEKETAVDVSLDYKGELTCTYPEYDGGWSVIAKPDGTLFDKDEKEYNYLYWEGTTDVEYDFSKGFCIKGEDSAKFLETALEKLGLTRREANEFIVYWLPLMEQNEYNVISFQQEAYTDNAELNISPAPDCMIRVFMAWYGVDKKIEIPEQQLTAPERHGFTVVEWGGSEVK